MLLEKLRIQLKDLDVLLKKNDRLIKRLVFDSSRCYSCQPLDYCNICEDEPKLYFWGLMLFLYRWSGRVFFYMLCKMLSLNFV